MFAEELGDNALYTLICCSGLPASQGPRLVGSNSTLHCHLRDADPLELLNSIGQSLAE